MTILDFCGHCAAILPTGLGKEPDPHCPNCGGNVKARGNRLQGEFADGEAHMLLDILGYAP